MRFWRRCMIYGLFGVIAGYYSIHTSTLVYWWLFSCVALADLCL